MRKAGLSLAAVAALVVGAVLAEGSALAPRAASAPAGKAPDALVKITPLGSHEGEFCRADRALLFEDPTGVRVLYDPAMTVAGGVDSRLGDVHALLVSSAHGDHLGSAKLNAVQPGTCAQPAVVPATPNSNTGEIAAAKNSAVLVGGELEGFLSARIASIRGAPTARCPATGLSNTLVVPRSEPCTGGLRHGGKRTVATSADGPGVQVAVVTAVHSNGLGPDFLSDPEKTELDRDGLTAYVGPENGFVLRFTNGLSVYLSGDTGHTADMEAIVRRYYRPNLAVMNMGDIFTMGPEEAAFAVKALVRPRAVIPSHANEEATRGGEVLAGTRTARFIELVRVPAHVPLSGVTMSFSGRGSCVAGCR
jgi:L-ascorbate metabolism protein UlaG (beta-lactamase superfamily)